MSNNIGTLFMVVSMVLVLFGMISLTSTEIQQKNSQLDNSSVEMLTNLNTEVNQNFQPSDIQQEPDNLTENSSFEGTDPFQREFLESKSQSENQRSSVSKIFAVPDLMINSVGVENNDVVIMIKGTIAAILSLFAVLAFYKGWKTGEVDG